MSDFEQLWEQFECLQRKIDANRWKKMNKEALKKMWKQAGDKELENMITKLSGGKKEDCGCKDKN